MANGGWYGTKDEWARIEAPLKNLDPQLEQFAARHHLVVTKNHKGEPERSIRWGDKVQCLIQIWLVDETALTLNFWLCASEDRDNARYWKTDMPRKEVQSSELEQGLDQLLEDGKRTLDEWSKNPESFAFATKLASYP